MGIKNDTAKLATAIAVLPAATVKTTPSPRVIAPVAIKPAAASPPEINGDRTPAKSEPAKKIKTVRKAAVTRTVLISTEDIALRAYFIAENRQRNGLHGDSQSDWLEAERQLKKERKKTTPKKKPAAKKKPVAKKKA